jgi:hypothetical protein
MADWKQITARIRRARLGKDPAGQLTNLFSKTRDAMVAFELARYFELSGNAADAGRWYLTAAERFRRADWKTKAQENAVRLGATEPAVVSAPMPPAETVEGPTESAPQNAELASQQAESESEPARPVQAIPQEGEPAEAATAKNVVAQPRQRRGRRGGRDQRSQRRNQPSRERAPMPASRPASEESAAVKLSEIPEEVEDVRKSPLPSLRGRSGDPGLSSRLTQLEMSFRRLLACPPTKLEDADKAPAGPGVWVLTDSDLSTYYYVEACQTLRVAIPNLLRSGAARRGESIKPLLAQHLGIPETKVAKYLGDHCVVRWLQMDEDASHFAHFLIAVLHPALNE